jgi:hypothetical protein
MSKRTAILLLVLLVSVSQIEAQCAMCRAVLEAEDGGRAAEGINNGILYLMVFPYLLIGIIGFFIYKSRKKAKSS